MEDSMDMSSFKKSPEIIRSSFHPNPSPPRHRHLTFLFGFLISLVGSWHNLMMPFLAPSDLPKTCLASGNISFEPRSTQIDKIDIDSDQCNVVFNVSWNHSETMACDRWNYSDSRGANLVTEFDLVCDREWMISLGQSVFMGGYVGAMIVFGHLSDRLGRRPSAFLAMGMFAVAGFLCLLSPNYLFFTSFRYFVSMGVSGAGITIFILLMELLDPKERPRYGVGYQFGWCTGLVILPAIAWFIRDWFYLQMVVSVPSVFLLGFWWLVPESPHWLRSCGKLKDSTEKDARLHVFVQDETDATNEKEESQEVKEKQPSVLDLFRTRNMRKKTIILMFCWFVNSFVYFGLSLNSGNLGGDPYLNFFIAGAIEFPAYIIATHLIRAVGRRIPQITAFLVGGVACLLTIPVMDGPLWMSIALAMTGKFFITASFAIIHVISAELFPTVVRTLGVCLCSLSARLGTMCVPFIKELGEASHRSVPFAVFGSLSVLSGLSVILLPETHLTHLPDSLKDGEFFT